MQWNQFFAVCGQIIVGSVVLTTVVAFTVYTVGNTIADVKLRYLRECRKLSS